MTPQEVRARFEHGPMNLFRIRTVILTLLISTLDGYDALSISFAAPAISTDWHVGKAALGLVLSSSLAGMAVGALLLAPVADMVGRKKLMLFGLMLMALGSLLSAFAGDTTMLMAWRLVTGIGIGACVAVISTVAAEFSNRRTRPMAMAVMSIGYPIGGLLGGLLAAWLLRYFTWHSIFIAGFAAGAVMIPVIMLLLPESLAYLLVREQPRRLEQINALLLRSGLPVLDSVPELLRERSGYAGVFAPEQLAVTIRLAIVSAITTAVAYFSLSWLPQIVALSGFDPSAASLVAAAASLTGIVGGLIFGLTARGSRQTTFTALAIMGEGVALALFGLMPPSMAALLPAGALIGLFLYSAATGFYAIIPQNFPDASRAAGTGFTMGVGRFASIFAPSLAGWLMAEGVSALHVFWLFAVAALVAGVVLIRHRTPFAMSRVEPAAVA